MDHVTNPELLRQATPDLSGGIPHRLFFGSDPDTQRHLVAEAKRQQAALRHADDTRTRALRDAAARFAAGPVTPAPDSPRGQLLSLQPVLTELAAVVGNVAANLPDSNPGADAPH